MKKIAIIGAGVYGCWIAFTLSKKGYEISIFEKNNEIISENIWEKIEVDELDDELIPFLMTIPLQKLAFYSALEKGYDIDKPRNLAKSVTVE